MQKRSRKLVWQQAPVHLLAVLKINEPTSYEILLSGRCGENDCMVEQQEAAKQPWLEKRNPR
jgi:hypothetical protein